MKPCFFLFLLLLAGPTPAWARIGETIEQCVRRYGPSAEAAAGQGGQVESTHHIKNGFSVSIMYTDKVADTLIITRINSLGGPGHAPITRPQLDGLLRANRGRSIWGDPVATADLEADIDGEPSTSYRWVTTDGRLEATYTGHLRLFIIITANRKAANRAATASSSLDGF